MVQGQSTSELHEGSPAEVIYIGSRGLVTSAAARAALPDPLR